MSNRSNSWYRVGDRGAPGIGELVDARAIGSDYSWRGRLVRVEDTAWVVTIQDAEHASRMTAGEIRRS